MVVGLNTLAMVGALGATSTAPTVQAMPDAAVGRTAISAPRSVLISVVSDPTGADKIGKGGIIGGNDP